MFLCLLFSVSRLLNFIPIPPRQNLTHSLLHPPITTRTHKPNNIYPNNPLLCFLKKTGQSVPSAPPQDITCTSPSSTSILVSWAPPPLEFQNGVITGYSIQYSTTERNKTSKRIDGIPPESSPHLLENLDKWTEYGITIRAQTEAGDGPESLQLLIRTEEDGMFQSKPHACLRTVRPTNNGYLTNIALMSSEQPKLTASCVRRPLKAFCRFLSRSQNKWCI